MAKTQRKSTPKGKTQPTKAEGTEEKEEKAPRVPFADTDLGERNDDGLIVGVPTEFDGTKHLKPKRDDFADQADFFDFRAMLCDERVTHFTEQAASYRKRAEDFRKFGDPEKVKLAARADRLRAKLAELEAQLEDEGADEIED